MNNQLKGKKRLKIAKNLSIIYNTHMSKSKNKNNLSLEERKIINTFLKSKNFEIIERDFGKNFETAKYVVEEKSSKEYIRLEEEKSEYNIQKINSKIGSTVVKEYEPKKLRFIVVQSLNALNQSYEFKKKRVSKSFLKEKNIIKNIFNYIIANNIKDEVSLDMLQVYINGETRKVKYRKNIANIKNFSKIDPLRNAA